MPYLRILSLIVQNLWQACKGMQTANRGTCQSNSSHLASSMHCHEAPASTAVRNASINLPHVHRLEARNSDMIDVTVGGPIIPAPSGPKIFTRLDDHQTSSSNEPRVLTLQTVCVYLQRR